MSFSSRQDTKYKGTIYSWKVFDVFPEEEENYCVGSHHHGEELKKRLQ